MIIPERDEHIFLELCEVLRSSIMKYYKGHYKTVAKDDKSPLTEADLASNEIILRTLNDHYPSIPILSEEGKTIPYDERKNWEYFWVVDPLDGTKEFVHEKDEFTVNIALVHNNKPVFGMVYVPVYDTVYFGYKNGGACKIKSGQRIKIECSTLAHTIKLRVAVSRFHLDATTTAFLKEFENLCIPVTRGSALKFCSVAEGDVDFYLRFGPTWEWDTAAGHAVVEAAGGSVLDIEGEQINYNKPTLKNGPLFVVPDEGWFKNSNFWKWIQKNAKKIL